MVLSEPAARPTALWVTPAAEVGGVTRHVLDVARAGIPGWRLVVLCPEGELAERLRAAGCAVVTGPVAPADGARTAVATIRRVARSLGPDVLHTHLAFADLTGAAAVAGLRSAAGRRIRVVSTEHGIGGVRGMYQRSELRARGTVAAHRARLRRTDHVIAVCTSTREQVLAQWGSGAPVTVIRHGLERCDPVPPVAGLRVLSLSRLAPEKRVDQTLRAFALVLGERADARLTVAGEGPLREELTRLVAELGLADAVTFAGTVEPGPALAAHDVVVQLSRWENLSYTLLDAAARGLGVVASPVGGNAEIVPARCLVDPEDTAGVAARILEQGLDLAARPSSASVAGSVDDMTEAIAAVYAGAVRGTGEAR